MFEVPTGASTWSYVPQLVLRDSSVREGSAVIAARFDMPALAGPLPSCAMNRPIGLFADVPIFHALYYDEYEIMIGRSDRSATGEVVAHLTVRTPEGTAATLILRGPIDQGAIPANYGGTPVSASAMWLTCG
jgi:hypothetical protein